MEVTSHESFWTPIPTNEGSSDKRVEDEGEGDGEDEGAGEGEGKGEGVGVAASVVAETGLVTADRWPVEETAAT